MQHATVYPNATATNTHRGDESSPQRPAHERRDPQEIAKGRWESEGGSPSDQIASGPSSQEGATGAQERLTEFAREGAREVRRSLKQVDQAAQDQPWRTATLAAFAGGVLGAAIGAWAMRRR